MEDTYRAVGPGTHSMCRAFALAAFAATALGLPRPGPGFASQSPLTGTQRQDGFGPLQFRSDGTFHISIFEDLHFGESERRYPLTPLAMALTRVSTPPM